MTPGLKRRDMETETHREKAKWQQKQRLE